MKIFYQILLISITLWSCNNTQNQQQNLKTPEKKLNQDLADELSRMAEVDQIAAYIPQGKYKEWSGERWDNFKDSVFTTHQKRLENIFNQYGFVGYDLAGKQGSFNFWLLVQHSDHVPEFQQRVLAKMKDEVEKNNASSTNYALLVDRVNINTGKPQIYGTQLTYDPTTGQAFPKSLEDSINVNSRRKAMGLDPLEQYLNEMTLLHFEMNQKNLKKQGITKPKLYPTATNKN